MEIIYQSYHILMAANMKLKKLLKLFAYRIYIFFSLLTKIAVTFSRYIRIMQ